MAEYKIFFKSSVWKDLKEIPDKDLSKILACIETLGKNPRQPSCKKLSGQENIDCGMEITVSFTQFRITN